MVHATAKHIPTITPQKVPASGDRTCTNPVPKASMASSAARKSVGALPKIAGLDGPVKRRSRGDLEAGCGCGVASGAESAPVRGIEVMKQTNSRRRSLSRETTTALKHGRCGQKHIGSPQMGEHCQRTIGSPRSVVHAVSVPSYRPPRQPASSKFRRRRCCCRSTACSGGSDPGMRSRQMRLGIFRAAEPQS
jgi:hypothetical protein